MHNYNTEYLILHEPEINWEALSSDKDRSFSLPEIRMFRKRIDWVAYLSCHDITHDELEVASKHFTQSVYNIIALLDLADDEFIKTHKFDFNWEILIANSTISAELLSECLSAWKNIPKENLEKAFLSNTKIDIHDGTYDAILLYLGLK